MAAAGLMTYLSSSLLSERLLPMALWSVLEGQTTGGTAHNAAPRMILDATALAAIEVVETLEGAWASREVVRILILFVTFIAISLIIINS